MAFKTPILLLAGALLGAPAFADASPQTALDDYVQAMDPAFDYELVSEENFPGYTVYQLRLTSQTWRSAAEVDHTLWQHWLTLVVPVNARSNTALLIVTGGSNTSSAPEIDPLIGAYAAKAKSVIAQINNVPNQPLVFTDDDIRRTEDSIIAYTFDKYLTTGDETWPLLLPMTKSAVAAMDATQMFLGGDLPRGKRVRVDEFVVSGGSKRGWTTWLTSAVDDRVKAIAPLVIDVLEFEEQLDNHYRSYGFYSSSLDDYAEINLPCRMFTPEGQDLLQIVDPISYLERYTFPKYLINGAGDQFFLPTGSNFYYDSLPGEKHLRYMPNVDHGLSAEVAPSALEFLELVISDKPRPSLTWTKDADGFITATPSETPLEVRLWQATNPNGRDFRKEIIGEAWTSETLGVGPDGTYKGRAVAPASGFTAYFLEVTYPSDDRAKPIVETTDVRVVPDIFPSGPEVCD